MPAGVALASACAMLALTFPLFVLHYGVAGSWGEFIVAPWLVVVVGVGIAGGVAPQWWTWKRALAISLIGFAALFGMVRRDSHEPLLPDHPIGSTSR